MNAIEVLKAERIPTSSAIRAIQHLRDNEMLNYGFGANSYYKDMIKRLTGLDAPTDDDYELSFTFRYLVQEGIHHPEDPGAELLQVSYHKAREYLERNPHVRAQPDTAVSEFAPKKLDAAGNPKQKKGAKKEHAQRIYKDQIEGKGLSRKDAIAILVKEVGLTPAGASTYYANLKAGRM